MTINPNCSETHAMLRIVGSQIEPEVLTSALGISPTLQVSPGDVFPTGTRARTEGIWAIDTEKTHDSLDLEKHIRFLLDQLPSNFRDVIPPSARCEILCVWRSATGHGGPSLSSSLLSRLAIAGIDLDFDFYCNS
jgi:Domain of unknown function (DUF4279)